MREQPRGFVGIGTYSPKQLCNTGTLYRSAMNFGADFTFTIEARYKLTKADTCKHFRHLPMWGFLTIEELLQAQPRESVLVGVELHPKAHKLTNYIHPERALYLLGAEDFGLPEHILRHCNHTVQVPTLTRESLNVAVAGSIILYDRQNKLGVI